MKNAIYMEIDSFDGKYKTTSDIESNEDYFLGDLVVFSNSNKPNSSYTVDCHFQESLVSDSFVKVGKYKRGYLYQLVFTGSKLKTGKPLYFYTKRIKNIRVSFKYAWVLQESAIASKMLDELEGKFEYNPLGSSILRDE